MTEQISLTEKEKKVLNMLKEGKSQREMARTLLMSYTAFQTMFYRFRQKAGCSKNTQLMAWAYENNYIKNE